MSKLNETLYRKLFACAEEADKQGMVKLASNIKEAIGDEPAVQPEKYSYGSMENDVQKELWKVATHLARYWGVNGMDVVKLDNAISVLAAELIDDVEHTLGVNSAGIGPNDPKVPGQQ